VRDIELEDFLAPDERRVEAAAHDGVGTWEAVSPQLEAEELEGAGSLRLGPADPE
jgi:hypothetical protein